MKLQYYSTSFTVDEGETAVATLAATDADANTTLSYALSGTDAASFTLDSSTGQFAFVSS